MRASGSPPCAATTASGVGREIPELDLEFARVRHDVQGAAAVDHADMQGRVRHLVGVVAGSRALDLGLAGADPADEIAGEMDRVQSRGRSGGMGRPAMAMRSERGLAFVPHGGAQQGRLADDAERRQVSPAGHVLDQRAYT